METRTCLLLLATLLLFVASSPAGACACFYSHLQSYFCMWDVVIKGKILNESERNRSMYSTKGYDIETLKVFKSKEGLLNFTFLSTLVGTSCEWSPNTRYIDYVITGDGYGDEFLSTSQCGYNQPWSHLTKSQIKGIQGKYEEGCSCTIYDCYGGPCINDRSDQCMLDYTYSNVDSNVDNQLNHQACIKNDQGICTWVTIED